MPDPATPDSTAQAFKLITFEEIKQQGFDLVWEIGSRLLLAVLIIIIGFWITRRVIKVMKKVMEKRDIDVTLRPFVVGFTGFMMRALVFIIAVSTAGVQMTSIIAVLGSIGLAIGLALQGSLANFAGGVIILVLKPFKVGERIEANGVAGFVQEISVFNTTLLTLDNRTIYIPNGPLAGDTIVNYNRAKTRRVDAKVGISYSNKVDDARKAILELVKEDARILPEPAPMVALESFGDSSLNLVVRVWADANDYWDVMFWLNERMKQEFDAKGINIPFPQRDIHIISK